MRRCAWAGVRARRSLTPQRRRSPIGLSSSSTPILRNGFIFASNDAASEIAVGMQHGSPRLMSNRWHIGAKQLRGAIASYAKRFDWLEGRAVVPSAGPPEASDRPKGKPVASHLSRAEELHPA